MRRAVAPSGVALLWLPATALAVEAAAAPPDARALLGRLHPALVHFPIALILVAAVAELLCVARKDGRYADAARFMVTAAAWISLPAAATGFLRAGNITMDATEQHLFVVHRIAGIATPVLIFLCAGLGEGVRRSGQIWELMLYRAVLLMSAVSAVIAGYYGGEIVFGAGFFPLW